MPVEEIRGRERRPRREKPGPRVPGRPGVLGAGWEVERRVRRGEAKIGEEGHGPTRTVPILERSWFRDRPFGLERSIERSRWDHGRSRTDPRTPPPSPPRVRLVLSRLPMLTWTGGETGWTSVPAGTSVHEEDTTSQERHPTLHKSVGSGKNRPRSLSPHRPPSAIGCRPPKAYEWKAPP